MVKTNSKGSKDEIIAGLTADDLAPENITTTAFNALGGKGLIKELGSMAVTDVGYQIGDLTKTYVVGIAIDAAAGYDKITFIHAGNKDVIKENASKAIDFAVPFIKPGIDAIGAIKQHTQIKAGISEELQEYTAAGFKGIDVLGNTGNNKVLDALNQKISSQFKLDMAKAGVSLAGSLVVAKTREFDKQARADKIDEIATTRIEALGSDGKTADPTQVEKIRQQAEKAKDALKDRMIANVVSRNPSEKLMGETFQYENQFLNKTSITALGAAAGIGHVKTGISNAEKGKSDQVIAYDLIQYLNEAIKKGDIDKGNIDLAKFKQAHKGHRFHALNSSKNEVSVADFITEIFEQHVRDQGAEGIGTRHDEKLKYASQKLADAITGKEFDVMTGATLHPLALIDIVGQGKIVTHDGLHVVGETLVNNTVEELRDQMPFEKSIDAKNYLVELAQTREEIKQTLKDLPEQAEGFMTFLLPTQVLTDSLGMSERQVKQLKTEAQSDALDNLKLVVTDLASLSDDELKADDLTTKQIKLIRDAAKHIDGCEDDKLLASLRDTDTNGLRFAVLSAKSYWHELANGLEMGELAHPPKTQTHEVEHIEIPDKTPASEVQKIEGAANDIKPFARKDKGEQDVATSELAEEEHNPAKSSKAVKDILSKGKSGGKAHEAILEKGKKEFSPAAIASAREAELGAAMAR